MRFERLPGPQSDNHASRLPWGRETIVIHDASTRAVYGRHSAPLSLKATLAGEERYKVDGPFQTVRPGSHLVVNDGQLYESAIDADAPVESLCIFFSCSDAAAARQMGAGDGQLLDGPDHAGEPREYAAAVERTGPALAALLRQLPAARRAPALHSEELALRLLAAMADAEKIHWLRSSRLDALRVSTRRELYRRCLAARAFLEEAYTEDIALADLAAVAELSKAHFLRSFRAAFGEPPRAMLQRIRLDRAADLLARRRSVTETALSVGYGDFSAFARAFRRRFGVSPSEYRRNI